MGLVNGRGISGFLDLAATTRVTSGSLGLMRWPLILALLFIASPALADITGIATVIDGDTIVIDGEHIRLHGIDAPEFRQTCIADGAIWPCGQWATAALVKFIGTELVSCRARGEDQYGRTIAACTVRSEGVEAYMVRSGWAQSPFAATCRPSRVLPLPSSARKPDRSDQRDKTLPETTKRPSITPPATPLPAITVAPTKTAAAAPPQVSHPRR